MNTLKTPRAVLATVGAAALFSSAVHLADAATATSTFQVTASVQALCSIGASNLDFGTYSGAAKTATSTITVTCTNTTPYNVQLNEGTGAGATVTSRLMTSSGGATLNYGLFRDSARTQNWGRTNETDTASGVGNGGPQQITVFGEVPAGQFVTPSAYTDTITATIEF